MGRQRWLREIERQSPPPARRERTEHTGDGDRRAGGLGPIEQSVLALQRTAGNSAVATAIRSLAGGTGVVQREPRPKNKPKNKKKQPKWVTDAQAALVTLFPNDPLMKDVLIKDYSDLNKTLQKGHFAAWTQSSTEIFLRDPTKPDDPKHPPPKSWAPMVVQFVLHHEAVHIRQFDKAGQPKTWQQMLEFEKAAYESDLAWLDGDGAKLITDADLFDLMKETVATNLKDVDALLSDTSKLSGETREQALHKGMISRDLIPSGSKLDPLELYKQP